MCAVWCDGYHIRLIIKSLLHVHIMTLAKFAMLLQADYVTEVEDRPIMSVK